MNFDTLFFGALILLIWGPLIFKFIKYTPYILNGIEAKAAVQNYWCVAGRFVFECTFIDKISRLEHRVEIISRRRWMQNPLWLPHTISIVYLFDNPQKVIIGSRLLFSLMFIWQTLGSVICSFIIWYALIAFGFNIDLGYF